MLKAGTIIELRGTPSLGVNPEIARIGRWSVKRNGPRMDGWHIVKFDDGGRLCVHESNFRVVSNNF